MLNVLLKPNPIIVLNNMYRAENYILPSDKGAELVAFFALGKLGSLTSLFFRTYFSEYNVTARLQLLRNRRVN